MVTLEELQNVTASVRKPLNITFSPQIWNYEEKKVIKIHYSNVPRATQTQVEGALVKTRHET